MVAAATAAPHAVTTRIRAAAAEEGLQKT